MGAFFLFGGVLLFCNTAFTYKITKKINPPFVGLTFLTIGIGFPLAASDIKDTASLLAFVVDFPAACVCPVFIMTGALILVCHIASLFKRR
ncbi:MAG: hypothetical protein LBP26_02235 [Clostridiales bacterium]|nr:hypothetical protein [Clostridiales bacterium]